MHLPGGKLWKRLRTLRQCLRAAHISVYSAGACFFLTLAALPALSLLTRLPGLDSALLTRLLSPLLPDPLREAAAAPDATDEIKRKSLASVELIQEINGFVNVDLMNP
jgi:hypothetical protein